MLKRIPLFGRTLSVNIQQLGGHVAHFFRRFLACTRPGIAAQLVQRRILFRAPGVAADQMQGRHRNIQLGVVSVGQHQVFTFDATCFEGGHPLIATHTVFQVNNRLTGVQFGQVADQGVRVDGATAVLTTARDALAQQVAFTYQRQVIERINESVLGGADHQVTAISGRFAQAKNALRRNFDPSQQFAQRFTATFTFNGEDHRPGEGLKKLAQIIERGFLLRLNGQVRQHPEGEVSVGGLIGKRIGFELHTRPAFQLGVELVGTQPQHFRRQQRTHRVNAPVFKAGARFAFKAAGAGVDIPGVNNQRICREVAEQRRQRFVKEQGLPVLDPGRKGALADLLVDMFGIALHVEPVAPLAAEQFDGGFIRRELMGGQQINGVHFLQRALGVGVEHAQAVDLIIEEIQTIRPVAAHRIEIQQRTARRVFAVLHHLVDMSIAGSVQLHAQGIARQALAFFHHQRMAVQIAVRTDALHQGIHRHNQHAALHGGELIQRRQARGDDLLVRRETVVGKRFPVGQAEYQTVGELTNFVVQAQGVLHVRGNQHHRPWMPLGNFRHQRGAGRACQFAQLALVTCFYRQGKTIVFRHGYVRVSWGYTNSIGAYH